MVLCPSHLDAATQGAMTESEQRSAKASPVNPERGFTDGLLAIDQDYCAIDMGAIQFIGDGTFIRVDDDSLLSLSLREGRLHVSVALHDEDDRVLALVDENEWISGDPGAWDLEADRRWLMLREKDQDIHLQVDARREPLFIRGSLRFKGHAIELTSRAVLVDQAEMRRGVSDLAFVAMGIAIDSASGVVRTVPDPSFEKGEVVSHPDRLQRIAQGVNVFSRLRDGR